MKKTADYQEFLVERLRKDEALREAYLNEALEHEDQKMILVALRNVAQATGGLSRLSKQTGLNRQNLYRILSKGGNPTWERIEKIFDGLGYPLRAVSKKSWASVHEKPAAYKTKKLNRLRTGLSGGRPIPRSPRVFPSYWNPRELYPWNLFLFSHVADMVGEVQGMKVGPLGLIQRS
jgi:probable addiction module antidote protein